MENRFLVLIKPEIVAHRVLRMVAIGDLKNNGIAIEKMRTMRVDRELAEQLYEQHKGKFFYNRLVRHISSGEVIAMRVNGSPRRFIGSSRLYPRADPDAQSLRQRLALSDVRNVAHASDEDVAQRELRLFRLDD